MKKITLLFLFFASSIVVAQTPCSGGTAAGFPCNGYDLQSHISNGALAGGTGSDSWGWTDPSSGKEYGIMGLNNGTAFIDISDPVNPIWVGTLASHTPPGTPDWWRDIKVYNDHAFIVSENPGHGMQVFDLSRLGGVTTTPTIFDVDAHYAEFGSAHNIAINEDTGYAYAVGTSTFGNGAHFINIQDPINPVAAGGYSGGGYMHDAQIVTYSGPDTAYTGREILVGSNANKGVIVDVTDKSNPISISEFTYSNADYVHQGWFTEDQAYFLIGDEGDEPVFGFNTRTAIFDLTDLDNPQFHFDYFGNTAATDHNGYVKGDLFYLSCYSAGMSVIDISDIANGNMTEVGFFDTWPNDNNAGTNNGAWSVYPYFDSGNIIISDFDNGFFVIKSNIPLSIEDATESVFSMAPNPTTNAFTISSPNTRIDEIAIFNLIGQKVFSESFSGTSSEILNISNLESGIYLVSVNNTTTKKLVVN